MRHDVIWLNWPVDSFKLNEHSLNTYKAHFTDLPRITVVENEAQFLEALPSATHAVVWEFKKEWFAHAPLLKVLATPGAGRELLPSDAEMPSGVVRLNGAFHGQIISETILACMFAHARGLYRSYDWQREGVLWPRGALSPFCYTLAGTRAVILGYGNIGRTLAPKLETLGVSVTGIRRANFNELDNALAATDWLIMALPSDTGTDNILDALRLALLPPHAVVINIGRGNSIDEDALAEALRTHRLAAAFLDVFKNEPLTKASPLAQNLPGLYRLPHGSAFAPQYLELFFEELTKHEYYL